MKTPLLTLILLTVTALSQAPTLSFRKDTTFAWDASGVAGATKFRLYRSPALPRPIDGIFETAEFREVVPIVAGSLPPTTYKWLSMGDGLFYYTVTAIMENDDGSEFKESVYSNIIAHRIDTQPVPPPKVLRVIKLIAKNTGKGEAVIAWETNVPAKAFVRLFRNGNLKGTYPSPKDIKGKVRIDNLKRNSEYQFIVFLDDKKGNTFTSELTTLKTL